MSTHPVSLTLNGIPVTARVEPRTLLGDFLRDDQRLTGLHLACEHGVCGACNVQVDGQLSRACTQLAIQCDQQTVRTIEGFDDDALMALLREAFSAEHALQCGYCTPGMLMAAHDIVRRFPLPDEATVRRELSGNLCRCTGYAGIVRAVLAVAHAHPQHATGAEPVAAVNARRAVGEAGSALPSSPAPAAARAAGAAADGEQIAPPAQLRDDSNATTIARRFELPLPRATVWDFFCDVPAVAACMPGLDVTAFQGDRLRGVFTVKVGPIRAAFATVAQIGRNDADWSGRVESEGRDRITHSSTIARLDYRLLPLDAGAGTQVEVSAAFQIEGRLAEFGRPEILAALASQLTQRFAANVEQRLLSGEAGAPASGEALEIALGDAALAWARDVLARLWRLPSRIKSWWGRSPRR